ncbi:MAG TPA: response regulator transcription factor [Anaerolineales bacterium]|nr:response regulator transcription factor [Anaerolineales bacterium]
MTGERILVVDDEPHIVDLVGLYLKREGFQVETAYDGAQALERIHSREPALIVLDIMLPGVDGLEVCRRTRAESDVPIIMLTARDEDIDKIVGLELGADDYLTKPFNPRELVARVKAILRRGERIPRAGARPLKVGDVQVDPARREVRVAGELVSLRAKEFDLLFALAQHPGIVLTREQLLNLVWGFEFYGQTRTVDVHIAHLRKRVAGSRVVTIETVTGVGYKLVS